jgi:hypothetical protein
VSSPVVMPSFRNPPARCSRVQHHPRLVGAEAVQKERFTVRRVARIEERCIVVE